MARETLRTALIRSSKRLRRSRPNAASELCFLATVVEDEDSANAADAQGRVADLSKALSIEFAATDGHIPHHLVRLAEAVAWANAPVTSAHSSR